MANQAFKNMNGLFGFLDQIPNGGGDSEKGMDPFGMLGSVMGQFGGGQTQEEAAPVASTQAPAQDDMSALMANMSRFTGGPGGGYGTGSSSDMNVLPGMAAYTGYQTPETTKSNPLASPAANLYKKGLIGGAWYNK